MRPHHDYSHVRFLDPNSHCLRHPVGNYGPLLHLWQKVGLQRTPAQVYDLVLDPLFWIALAHLKLVHIGPSPVLGARLHLPLRQPALSLFP